MSAVGGLFRRRLVARTVSIVVLVVALAVPSFAGAEPGDSSSRAKALARAVADGRVLDLSVYSPSMKRHVPVRVLVPADRSVPRPTLYLLNGAGGGEGRVGRAGVVPREAGIAAHADRDREADRDVLDILADEGAPDTVIMHCFSGDQNVARECVERGYYLSFAGTVSFANAASLRDAARVVPDELLLVETDAPFLTPDPYRGQPNQSYCLPYTARSLASTRGVDAESLARTLGDNARRAYQLPLR